MEIIKLSEQYNISHRSENINYRGFVEYLLNTSIKLSIVIEDIHEILDGIVEYNIDQKKISSISFNNIPKEKEEIFTKYVNQIIEEVLEYFNFI